MLFTKEGAYTSDEQVEIPCRYGKIHYRFSVVSLIYIWSTIVYLCFALKNMAKFSSNPGKLHFAGLVQFLRYIRDSKNLGLKYYARIEDEPLADLFRKARIKTENQLMVFYDLRWQDYTYTGIITGSYIVFYQGGPIDHCTHVPAPVAPSSSERD